MAIEEKKEVLNVPENIIPCRIDVYLVQQSVGLSRNQIQKLIRNGKITVVGKGTKPNFILDGGEVIEIEFPPDEIHLLEPEDIPIEIVYEDEHLLVVNKPPGMVTHPARGNWQGTLLNAVLHHTKKLSNIGGDFRPGIIHRLDKGTSGLLIIAKRTLVHVKLTEMISKRDISRTYIALLWGHIAQDFVDVDAPIGYNPKDPTKRAIVNKGRPAKTRFGLIARFDYLDFVTAKLFTGRTHQIRVHAQHIGHPVLGDKEYGGCESRIDGIYPQYRVTARKILEIATRQMLHAVKIEFAHPVTKKMLSFKASLPQDFSEILKMLAGENWKLLVERF